MYSNGYNFWWNLLIYVEEKMLHQDFYHNLSLGLATKEKGSQGHRPRRM
jgi:hypothetical protein